MSLPVKTLLGTLSSFAGFAVPWVVAGDEYQERLSVLKKKAASGRPQLPSFFSLSQPTEQARSLGRWGPGVRGRWGIAPGVPTPGSRACLCPYDPRSCTELSPADPRWCGLPQGQQAVSRPLAVCVRRGWQALLAAVGAHVQLLTATRCGACASRWSAARTRTWTSACATTSRCAGAPEWGRQSHWCHCLVCLRQKHPPPLQLA